MQIQSEGLVGSCVDALDGLAIQRKSEMKLKFLEFGTKVKSQLFHLVPTVNQRRCGKCRMTNNEKDRIDEAEQGASGQFLLFRNAKIGLQDH